MFVQYVKLIFNGHPQTAISPLCPTLRRQHLNICREFWISDLFTGDEAHHLQHLDIFGQSQLIYYFQGTLRLDSWSSNEQLQCWPSESLICLIFIRGWRLHPNIFWIRSLRCLFTVSRKISVMSYLGSSKDWRVKKCKAPGPETILNCITKLLSIVIRSMWRYISALWQWRKLWPLDLSLFWKSKEESQTDVPGRLWPKMWSQELHSWAAKSSGTPSIYITRTKCFSTSCGLILYVGHNVNLKSTETAIIIQLV